MTAVLDPKVTWYVARAAGIVTWLLCGMAIVWGLVLSTKVIRRRGLPAWLLDLHSFLGTLALVFCAIHIGGLAMDHYVNFGLAEILVPMKSGWRPGAVAWGIVAFYLLLAVQGTSWVRRRLPKRVWHSVHLTSFVLFAAGTVHGMTAGTDWPNAAVRYGTLAVVTPVVVLAVLRFTAKRRTGAPSARPLVSRRHEQPDPRPARPPTGRAEVAELGRT